MEVLAIVAYKQPVTRVEIERIRGVNTGSVLKTLMEKGFIIIKGRGDGLGKPLLYGITKSFFIAFGLNAITDLPNYKEISELMDSENINKSSKPKPEMNS